MQKSTLDVTRALNATLEWFDPQRGDIDELAAQYTDIVLHGLLVEGQALR